jgi:hypothetical protein
MQSSSADIRLTGQEIFAELLMTRQGDTRLVLIVEGDEECKLMDAHIVTDNAYTYPAGSKSAVRAAMTLMNGSGESWAIGVIDRDFDRSGPGQAGVVQSEHYDLIMDVVIAQSEQVRRLAINSSAPGRVNALELESSSSVHELIMACCLIIGCLRYAAKCGQFAGSARKFPTTGLVRSYVRGQAVEFVAQKGSERTGGIVGTQDIVQLIESPDPSLPPEDYACGHDYASTLADLIRYCGGPSVGKEFTAILLRTLATRQHWLEQPVAKSVSDWAHTYDVDVWQS